MRKKWHLAGIAVRTIDPRPPEQAHSENRRLRPVTRIAMKPWDMRLGGGWLGNAAGWILCERWETLPKQANEPAFGGCAACERMGEAQTRSPQERVPAEFRVLAQYNGVDGSLAK